jgi:hypothetical protein
VDLIGRVHRPVSVFARDIYQTHGRGAILFALPSVAPGVDVVVSTQMIYYTATKFELLFKELGDADRVAIGDVSLNLNEIHTLFRMIQTYDPSRQAVVSVRIGDHNAVSVKMELEPPLVTNERQRIH